MLKTSGYALGFQGSPRDLPNVNEWKIMFDPYIIKVTRLFVNHFTIQAQIYSYGHAMAITFDFEGGLFDEIK